MAAEIKIRIVEKDGKIAATAMLGTDDTSTEREIMAAHGVSRQVNNTLRFAAQRSSFKTVSEGCKEFARRMAEKNPGGGGLWRMRK